MLLFALLAIIPLAAAKCRCTPADDCWPSTSSWSTLNATVDGRLIHNQPIARPCYQGADYDAARCQEISADWADERWFSQFPTGYSYPTIETCPIINATLGPGRYPQCDLGNYPVYTVNASSTEHVAAGIRFARDNNIRLVIKNTGHDISQRSQGYGSLSVWIKHIKNGLQFHKRYISADNCPSDYTGSAIKVGGGYVWNDVFEFAHGHGAIVVGGADRTVGAIGGYLQGGGHGPASHSFGLAAEQVLEYTVVLASGRTVTANACHYTDLFAALRGGGGGTYGIVTSATIKAYPDRPALGHELTIVALPNRTADLLDVTADIMEHYPRLVDAGWSGNAILTQAAGPFVYTHPLVTLLGPGQNLSSPVAAHARELMEREVISRLLPNNGTSLLISSEFTLFPTFLDWYNTHTHMTDGQRRPMMASRFLDKASLASRDKNRGLLEVILDGQGNRTTTSSVTFFNLVAGGKVMQPQPHTAINPAWRSTYVVAQQIDLWPDDAGYEEIAQVKRELTHKKLAAMKTLAPGMGTYGNEADPYDPDWRHDWWGEDNYNWLVGVKRKYDPDDVFWCWRCVGNDAWGEILGGTLYGPLCETA